MLDHRMAAERAELAGDAHHHRLRLRPLKLDLALAEIGLRTGQCTKEIVIPERAAEFAVGDALEPDRLLPADHLFDFAILDRAQRRAIDLAALALGARLLQRGRAQQAADMIGAKGRFCPLHFLWSGIQFSSART